MKAILAVDGSPNAGDAAGEFARLAWSDAITVRVMTVVENIAPRSRIAWHGAIEALEQMRREETRQAEEYVARVANELRAAGRTAESVVRHGDPRLAIVAEAESWSADLVVVGAQGVSGIAKLLMGSVSQAVVASAPCSVMVVRRRAAGV